MFQEVPPTVLAIGVSGLPMRSSTLDIYVASTLRETLATIRLIGFDLVLAGFENESLNVWDAMERVLAVCPSQRWILASPEVAQEEEILARSLGALLVLNAVPDERWLTDFIASQRRRQLARRMPALSTSPAVPQLVGNIGAPAS